MSTVAVIEFLKVGAQALALLKGKAEAVDTVLAIIDRVTRYARLADEASSERSAFITDATAELKALLNGDKNALAGQLKRIRDRSERIASKTAILEERRAKRGKA